MNRFTKAQKQAVEILTGNMAVTAGAGAGKTRVLVERYLNLLRQQKAACDQIVAITFTKKAAKEMKERVRHAIDKICDESSDSELLFWYEAKEKLEYAPITTFHSFCGRLLRSYPVESGLDPNFLILDELETQIMAQEVIEGILEKAAQTNKSWLTELLQFFSLTHIYESIPEVYEKLLDSNYFNHKPLFDQLAEPYEAALSRVEALRQTCIESLDCCYQLLQSKKKSSNYSLNDLNQALERLSEEDDLNHLALQQFLKSFQGRGELKPLKEELQQSLARLVQHLNCAKARQWLEPLSCLLEQFHQVIVARKQEEQVLTYQDLEQKTLKLLTEHPAVVLRLQEQYRYMMVDEFQDTNEIQRKMLYLLSGGQADVLNSNRLFVVGDAKQSIYRFRGADVSVFGQVCQDIVNNGGHQVELDTNFRSKAELVDWFNAFFGFLMPNEDPVAFQSLSAGLESCSNQVVTELMVTAKEYYDQGQNVRQEEAKALTRRIKELVHSDSETDQKINYGDIVILLRSFSDIELYAWELQQAQIPFYILSGKGFFSCQEIIDFLNLLRVIQNPLNERPLAGVLRSPIGAVTDEKLFSLKKAGSLWQGLQATDDQVLQQFYKKLTQWQSLAKEKALSELMRIVLNECGYGQFVLTQFMGSQKRANLNKLVALAENFQERDYYGLDDFLRQIDCMIECEAREGQAQIESEAGNSVKIMTIHKSKGLEFPIVFVPDLQRKFQLRQPPILVLPGQGMGLSTKQNEDQEQNAVYLTMCETEKALAWLEMKRLFYVAATRAKEKLILSGVVDKTDSLKELAEGQNWLDWVLTALGVSNPAEMDEVMMLKGQPLRIWSYKPDDLQNTAPAYEGVSEKKKRWVQQIRGKQEHLGAVWQELIQPVADMLPAGPEILSATALRQLERCSRAFYWQYFALVPTGKLIKEGSITAQANLFCQEQESIPTAERGRYIGMVLHDCCEHYSNSDHPDLIEDALWRQVPLKHHDELRAEVTAIWQDVIESPSYQQLSQYEYESEWTFLYDLEGTLLQGSIDRLIFYPDGTLGIIDFKTDQIDEKNEEIMLKKAEFYEEQCALYAIAAEELFGQPVKTVDLYFLRVQKIQPLLLKELNFYKQKLLAQCEFIRMHRQIEDYVCRSESCSYCNYDYLCKS